MTGKETLNSAIKQIQDDMVQQHAYFEKEGRDAEAKRIMERTEFDLEMIRELGYCSGIENYSRYFDGRAPGSRPFCLLDYFPDDYLLVVDESHATMPQIRAMWGGDRSRKTALIEYGFRLPSALDNRPLTFNEFESMYRQAVFVSATPSDYELAQADGVVVEQIIRPTGLLDPEIDIRPSINQIDDLLDEVDNRVKMGDRVLVTTLTKRMAEELSKYMDRLGIKVEYVHSDVKTLDRVEILRKLRLGEIDVLIGVNLLREGLDLPEVSLVAILDADKEGFLRDQRSLIQTMGRAARNDKGKVIMYADRITGSMQRAIDETNRRRATQAGLQRNARHHAAHRAQEPRRNHGPDRPGRLPHRRSRRLRQPRRRRRGPGHGRRARGGHDEPRGARKAHQNHREADGSRRQRPRLPHRRPAARRAGRAAGHAEKQAGVGAHQHSLSSSTIHVCSGSCLSRPYFCSLCWPTPSNRQQHRISTCTSVTVQLKSAFCPLNQW